MDLVCLFFGFLAAFMLLLSSKVLMKGDGNVRFSGQMRQFLKNLKSYFHEILHGGHLFGVL